MTDVARMVYDLGLGGFRVLDKTNYNDDTKIGIVYLSVKSLSFLGDEIYDFIKLLRFTEIGDRVAVEKEFRSLIATILGTSDDAKISVVADKLYSKLRIWATSLREKSEICREDVYRAICSKQIDVPRFDY